MRARRGTEWLRSYQWDRIERHVREALGSLRSLHEYVLARQDGLKTEQELTEGQFAVAYEHIYHHLNFAWNTRKMSEEIAEKNFELNEKWPNEFDRFLNDDQIMTG